MASAEVPDQELSRLGEFEGHAGKPYIRQLLTVCSKLHMLCMSVSVSKTRSRI